MINNWQVKEGPYHYFYSIYFFLKSGFIVKDSINDLLLSYLAKLYLDYLTCGLQKSRQGKYNFWFNSFVNR